MATLYRHIRKDKNEVFYIGIGKDTKRAFDRFSRNKHWENIVDKTEWFVEIIFEDLSWSEACIKEIEFIKLYGRKCNNTGTLCNITAGGEGFVGSHTENTKKIISQLKKGNTYWVGKKHTESSKLKISKSKLGHSVNKGKSHIAWNKGTSKVDMVKVMEMLNSNIKVGEIAKFFNVHSSTISHYIKRYKNKND